jgi:hypothetical protein
MHWVSATRKNVLDKVPDYTKKLRAGSLLAHDWTAIALIILRQNTLSLPCYEANTFYSLELSKNNMIIKLVLDQLGNPKST